MAKYKREERERQRAARQQNTPTSQATPDGSVFLTRDSRYDGKRDHFFNESGNMSDPHGHVVEGRDSTPEKTTYDYARDADGTEYDVR